MNLPMPIRIVVRFIKHRLEFNEIAEPPHTVKMNPNIFPEPQAPLLIDNGNHPKRLGQ